MRFFQVRIKDDPQRPERKVAWLFEWLTGKWVYLDKSRSFKVEPRDKNAQFEAEMKARHAAGTEGYAFIPDGEEPGG